MNIKRIWLSTYIHFEEIEFEMLKQMLEVKVEEAGEEEPEKQAFQCAQPHFAIKDI
jgi:hypothetical protein